MTTIAEAPPNRKSLILPLPYPLTPRWMPLFDARSRRSPYWPAPRRNVNMADDLVARHADLDYLTPDELADQLRLAKDITWRFPLRQPGRRWVNERIGRIRSALRTLPADDACAWRCGR